MNRIFIVALIAALTVLYGVLSYSRVISSSSLTPAQRPLVNPFASSRNLSELMILNSPAPIKHLHLKLKPAGFSNSLQCLRFSRNFAQLYGFLLHLPNSITTSNHHDSTPFSFPQIFQSDDQLPAAAEQCQNPVTVEITGNGNNLIKDRTETPCLVISCAWIWTDCFLTNRVFDAYLPKFADKADRIVSTMPQLVQAAKSPSAKARTAGAVDFTFLSAHIRLGDRAKHSQPLLPFPCEDAGLVTPETQDSLATCFTPTREPLNFSGAFQVLHGLYPGAQALFLSSDRPVDARKLVGNLPGLRVLTIDNFPSELDSRSPESVLTLLVEQEIWIRSAAHLSTWPSSITERTLLMKQARDPASRGLVPFRQAVLRLHQRYEPPTHCPLLEDAG